MMRHIAFLTVFLSTMLANAATVDVTYYFSGFTGRTTPVSQVIFTPLAPGADYSGAQLSTAPTYYTPKTLPTMTNGYCTISNVLNGYAYKVQFNDGWSNPSITNYFPTNVVGAVNGNDYKTSLYQMSASGGRIVKVWYYATIPASLTNLAYALEAGHATNATWATTATNVINIPSVVITNNASGVTLTGTFSGIGSGLTNLGRSDTLFNLGFGDSSLSAIAGRSYNSAFGYASMQSANCDQSTAFGYAVLLADSGGYNSAFGSASMFANSSGFANSAFGYASMTANKSGNNNCAFGLGSLSQNVSGYANVAVGVNTMLGNTNGFSNTALGTGALSANKSGIQNVAVGDTALGSNEGSQNVAIGDSALIWSVRGNGNTAVGEASMNLNSIGSFNSAFGISSLASSGASSNNVAVGLNSLFALTNSDWNVAVGANSGYGQLSANQFSVSDQQMTFIGALACRDNSIPNTTPLTNGIAIGYGATVGSSHTAVIGGTNLVKTILNGNVGIGINPPTSKLHIAGQYDTPLLKVTELTSGSEHAAGLGLNAQNSQWSTSIWLDGRPVFTAAGNNGVGIGYVSGVSFPANGLIVQGNAGFGTAVPGSTLSVNGLLTVTNGARMWGSTGLTNFTETTSAGWLNTNFNGGNVKIQQGAVTASGTVTATNFLLSTPRWVDSPIQYVWPSGGPTAPALTIPDGGLVGGLGLTETADELLGVCQINHQVCASNTAYAQNLYTEIHLHMQPATKPTSSTTNATFRLTYTAGNIGGNYYGPFVVTNTIGMNTVTNRTHYLLEFGHIPASNYFPTISAIYRLKVEHIASAAQDYSGAIIVDGIDVHYPIDRLGSSQDASP